MTEEQLGDIKTFPQLVKYLRDELDWPINSTDFEDLTYDYSAEELGIDARNAARIEQIKRLRPLDVNQPWGVFFVKFEPRTLPVVALRRILGSVVLKKRASANKSEQAAWNAEDLLFISNYGQGQARQISFAHFSENPEKKDLPTLKVLGWDELDTALHMEDVGRTLKEHLTWPDDPSDREDWRRAWRSAFTLRHKEVVTTSKALAIRLAQLARAIRNRIHNVMDVETDKGPVTTLMRAFEEALINDLTADDFADMYAQTIAYGLLSARVTNPDANTADGFASQLPVTNPFLKELMETFMNVGGRRKGTGIDFDELGVGEVVDLLDHSNMEAVIRDFGDRNPQEDPVIHFYELFLKEYDAKKRMQRGVFYTPRPIVTFIIRSVHERLKSEFGLEDGLADIATWADMQKRHEGVQIPESVDENDRFVTILDPAAGTGTFLVEVIDVIHRTLVDKWEKESRNEAEILDLWNEYVAEHLLPRLHGYELLMAPYAIAHMKIGLKLHETRYRFEGTERTRVFLTNSLEPPQDFSGQLEFTVPALAHEAEAVSAVKKGTRFTIVIGNPPYSGFSANMNDWIDGLLRGSGPEGRKEPNYYEVDGQALSERKIWLQDDYVKFTRLSHHLLSRSGTGVHAFITNSSYLDGPTYRGMRWQLLRTFLSCSIVNLHGSLKRQVISQDGTRDENVFDIQQGVAIGIFSIGGPASKPGIQFSQFIGSRDSKYTALLDPAPLEWTPLLPKPPWFLLTTPSSTSAIDEYEDFFSVRDIFVVKSTAVQTSRDAFVVDFSATPLAQRIAPLGGPATDEEIRTKYGLKDGRNWKLSAARDDIRRSKDWQGSIRDYLYRAFDIRKVMFRDSLVNWPRHNVTDHLTEENVALLVPRQLAGTEFRHAFCTRVLPDMCVISTATKEAVQIHPLFLTDDGSTLGAPTKRTNFTDAFTRRLLQFLQKDALSEADALAAFGYIYAILYSPEYRKRYAEGLRMDFPRIPLPRARALYEGLSILGSELVRHHLLESSREVAAYVGPENPIVARVFWKDESVLIQSPKGEEIARFEGVPEETWEFRVGLFQVCEKWLKDRKGQRLFREDIELYQKLLVSISETIRIMSEIDEAIDQKGGWPDAFNSGEPH